MRLRRVPVPLLSAFATVLLPALAVAPLPVPGREEVEVRLVQVEVAAIPREEGVSCGDLRAEDLELRVNGRTRPVAGFDPLGAFGAVTTSPAATPPAAAGPDDRPPARIVLVFDAGAIRTFLCFPYGPRCPPVYPDDFVSEREARWVLLEWAERWLDLAWRPGDRWLVSLLNGGARPLTGWLEDREAVRAALRALGAEPSFWTGQPPAPGDAGWWRGWEDLLTTLEAVPGTKQVLWMTAMPPREFHPAALRRLAGRAQAARVALHPVNAFRLRCTTRDRGTWARFTSFTGGEELLEPPVAAEQFRRQASCRYLLSFEVEPRDDRRRLRTIRLEDRRGRFRFLLPGTWERRRDAPDPAERAAAALNLPGFRRGLDLDVRLVPLRPDRRGRRWRAVLLARLRWRAEDAARAVPDGLVLEMMVQEGSRTLAAHRETLDSAELATLRTDPRGRTRALPVVLRPDRLVDVAALVHPPGPWERAVLATTRERPGSDGGARPAPPGAWRRTAVHVPPLPARGRPGPFVLVDRAGRAGDRTIPVPALDDEITAGTVPLFMAWACAAQGRELPATPGPLALVGGGPAGDPAEVEVTLSWAPDPERPGCGWWIVTPARAPGAGAWALVSRDRKGEGDARPLVRFAVRPSPAASR